MKEIVDGFDEFIKSKGPAYIWPVNKVIFHDNGGLTAAGWKMANFGFFFHPKTRIKYMNFVSCNISTPQKVKMFIDAAE